MWSKIRNFVKSTNINSDDFDKKITKIKFKSDADLPPKTLELHNVKIVVRSVFSNDRKNKFS